MMQIDDAGRVWVTLETAGKKSRTLIVFRRDGTPEWKTNIPKSLDISGVENNSVYGIERDKNGMTSIVRYSVSFS